MSALGTEALDLLKQARVFQGAPEDTLRSISDRASFVRYEAGDLVFNAGDPGDAMYVIASGSVGIHVQSPGGPSSTCVAELGPMDFFGEMALLSGEPRSATVKALESTVLLRVLRDDFASLVQDPVLHREILEVLCARIRQTSSRLNAARSAQTALNRHLRGIAEYEQDEIVGTTKPSRDLAAAVERAAADDGPVLIEGEMGSGMSLVAALIARRSQRCRGPLVMIDCIASGDAAAAEIFGHEGGGESRQMGAFELCADGTVVVSEPQELPLMAQQHLLQAMKTGQFRRIGGDADVPVRVRIIVTRRRDPSAPVLENGGPEAGLFTGGHIVIPPLRERRRDIRLIADTLLDKHCRALGTQKPTLTDDAVEVLVTYDWPGNGRELDAVLRRAVALVDDGAIDAEQILIRLPSPGTTGKLDLFRIAPLKRFLTSRWYPLVLQVPTALVLGVIGFLCFFGPQDDSNIALRLTWPVWWAMLPLTFLFAGRIWCTICPFSLVSSLVQRLCCARLRVPKILRSTEIWPMTALFVFLTWADEFWQYPHHPVQTGYVLAAVLLGTLVFSLLYERRVWCRYFCPLGGVNGVYSSAAIVELRSNTDVCAHHCTKHGCVAKDSAVPCPMLEMPLNMDTNRSCNLCMNCAKSCNHDAMHLYLRWPGAEIWEQRKPMLSAGVLSVLLMGTMLVHAFCMHTEGMGQSLPQVGLAGLLGVQGDGMAWTVTFFGGLVLAALLAIATSVLSARCEGRRVADNLAHYGLAFAVMAILFHIALEGATFVAEGIPDVLAMVLGPLGAPADAGYYALLTPFLVRVLQVLAGLTAVGLTIVAIRRVAHQRGAAKMGTCHWPHLGLALGVGAAFVLLIGLTPLQAPATAVGAEAAVVGEVAGGGLAEAQAMPPTPAAPDATAPGAAREPREGPVAAPPFGKASTPGGAAEAPSAEPQKPYRPSGATVPRRGSGQF